MTTKTFRAMPSFEGVAAGATATLRCPIGLSFESLAIDYSGVTLAQITGIRVVANGKPFVRFTSGTQLDMVNQFHGRAAANGTLHLDFNRFGLLTRAGQELTRVGTGARSVEGSLELSTLTVEIDIAAAASAPVLRAKAYQSPPANLGLVKHVRNLTYNAGGAGEFEISDLPTGHLYNTLHFQSANITALRVERDRFVVWERTLAENNVILADGVRVPQSNVFHVDFTELGYGGEMMETRGVQDLRFVLTMSGSGSVPIVLESVAPLI